MIMHECLLRFEAIDGPYGVTAGHHTGRIAVTERKSNTVEVFTPDGKLHVRFGNPGKKHGEFDFPCDVAMVSNDERLLVTDSYNNRVQMFNSYTGDFIEMFGETFKHPRGITVDADGKVLVAHARKCCIYDSLGKLIRCLSEEPTDVDSQLRGVHAKDVRVYTVDRELHRVKIEDYSGTVLEEFGEYGKGEGQFDRPRGICITESNHILVADDRNNRVQRFDSNGRFIEVVISESDDSGVSSPTALSLTANGDLVVANFTNEIQVFRISQSQ